MTVKELREKLNDFPDESLVVIQVPTDYEDYDEVTDIMNCNYYRWRGGNINFEDDPNAVILR